MNRAAQRQEVAQALAEIIANAKGETTPLAIGLMSSGSELGREELLRGARLAVQLYPGLVVRPIGPPLAGYEDLDWIETPDSEDTICSGMEKALSDGSIAGAVALHYPFPLGVTTVGCVQTPARGLPMFLASTTGTAATQRVEAMLKSAIFGLAVAKAFGIPNPSLGVLNLEGAPSVQRLLRKLEEGGYSFAAGASKRSDGGMLLRGNDVLSASVDVSVTDSLTGNILMKVLSSFSSGGQVESAGWGYGPSVGENWDRVISIISRVSGAMVIANALALTARMARAGLPDLVKAEWQAAKKAGLDALLEDLRCQNAQAGQGGQAAAAVAMPPQEKVDAEISGIDVLAVEDAKTALWAKGIYAEPYMGCTGPVLKVAAARLEAAKTLLAEAGHI